VIAHVLSSNVIPDPAQWGAIGLTALGGLGVLRRRSKLLDAASWATFALGAVVCLGMVGVAMLSPVPPGYTLSLAVNGDVTSPVQLTACATWPDGSAATTPDGDHVLAVLVDGAQVATESASMFAVPMARGSHTLRIELLTRDHREFSPVVAVQSQVTVTGIAASTVWQGCARGPART
jgi:MYXO-CTERM domain-containing protein